jgi:chromosome segregation ATPase
VNGQGQGHMNTQTTTTNQDMGFNLQTILNDIQSRLTKLNLLDSINDRLRNIEQRFEMVENDISQLKRSVTEHEKYLETNELQCRDFHARIQNFEIARDELDHRTKEIHETLLDQQTRSMKYNLIFENIPEDIPNTDMKEDAQQIRKFCHNRWGLSITSRLQPMYIVKLYIFNLQFAL